MEISYYIFSLNYYFYQAKFFVKVKSIDKIDEGYIEITKDDGKKLKLTEIRVEEAIYHNVERKNKIYKMIN